MHFVRSHPVIKYQFFFSSLLVLNFYIGAVHASPADSLHLINNLRLGAEIHYGSVLPHNKTIEYSLNKNIERLQLTLTTNSYGRSYWDKRFRYPIYGVGYLYSSLGNKEVFGHAHAIFLFMDIPFSSREKNFSLGYQINFGISYLDRIFDISENPLNMAISSRLNVYGCFNINARFKLGDRQELIAGFNLSHYSNGKLATPNLGINTCTFSAGYTYAILPVRYSRGQYTEKPVVKKHQAEVIVSGGTKTDDQLTGTYFFISTLVVDYKYITGLKYSIGAGTDLFYDPSLGPNKVAEEGGSYTSADLFQLGMHGAVYSRYSRLNIMLQVGAYVHANYYKYARVYSRVGIRYEIAPHILLSLSLKSHYAIADYIEWGVGYRF
jgi:hypothetical protein